MERTIWVRVVVEGGRLQVNSNCPFADTIAMLESAKACLITKSANPPTVEQSEGDQPLAAARMPVFVPRRADAG